MRDEIPGLRKAIEIAEAYRKYDFANASNEKLDESDREQAFNCTCRAGQIISQMKLEISRIESGGPPREEMPGLQGLIVFARIFGPPGLQQDDQDFEEWKKDQAEGKLGSVYFSWPRGFPARATVKVELALKHVTLRLSGEQTPEEAYHYAWFAKELDNYLKGKDLTHVPVADRAPQPYNYGVKS